MSRKMRSRISADTALQIFARIADVLGEQNAIVEPRRLAITCDKTEFWRHYRDCEDGGTGRLKAIERDFGLPLNLACWAEEVGPAKAQAVVIHYRPTA